VDRLEETGFFTKWYDDAFFKAKVKAQVIAVNTARPLVFDDLQGAFYFMGIGAGIGIIALVGENMVRRLIDRKKAEVKRRARKRQKINKAFLHWNASLGRYEWIGNETLTLNV
ncbi:hypothetical protein AVEN_154023-2-1, partial [Araneus ventricosus]